MFRFVAVLGLLAVGGCGRDEGQSSRALMDANVEVAAKEQVRNRLRDPSAAEFRDFRVSYKGGHAIACGEVNGTNGFGGKAGFQGFVSNGGEITVLQEDMASGEFEKLKARYC